VDCRGNGQVLSVPLPPGCPSAVVYVQPHKQISHGGWLDSGVTLPNRLTQEQCDFDVITASDIESFLFEYLALQRPVLVRNATNSHEMGTLLQTWQRNKFEQVYGSLTFNEVEVPFCRILYVMEQIKQASKAFMAKMKQLYQDHQSWSADPRNTPSSHIHISRQSLLIPHCFETSSYRVS